MTGSSRHPRIRASRRAALLAVTLTWVVSVVSVVGPAHAAADPTRFVPAPAGAAASDPSAIVRYELPGDGPVVRWFEPPVTSYGAGHRGVDLDVAVGAPVHAAAGGTVAFAGPVAGTTWVAIVHPDGVTTSYGPIASLGVGRGHEVARGQPIGVLAAGGHGDGGLHWGARRHGTYVDPLSLLDGGIARPSLIGPGAWRATDHAATAYRPWGGARWGGLGYHGSPVAHAPGYALPPNGNHLVLVAGLGSSSETLPIDPVHLGYDLRDVTALSYAGRDDGLGQSGDPWRDQRPYDVTDTWEGVDAAARRLHEQLRAQQAREPGRAVDLVGYSMGGVVIAHYLANHHDAYDRSLPAVGHVVTVAAPLQGSDLASLGADLHAHRVYGPVLEVVTDRLARADGPVGRHVGPLPLGQPSLHDLRVGSALLDELAQGMEGAVEAGVAGPLAMGTRILTIAGGTDVVVGAGRARLPDLADGGAGDPDDVAPVEHRVLPGDHARVLRTEAVREVVWRFLADEEVVASPGHASTWLSDAAGHVVRYAGWRVDASDRLLAPYVPAWEGR